MDPKALKAPFIRRAYAASFCIHDEAFAAEEELSKVGALRNSAAPRIVRMVAASQIH